MGKEYTKAEDDILRKAWKTWTRWEILAALPDRSWSGIDHRARALGLKRDRNREAIKAASEKANAARWGDNEFEQTVIIKPAPSKDSWIERAISHRTPLEEAWR